MNEYLQRALEEGLKKEAEEIKNKLVEQYERELSQKIAGVVFNTMKTVTVDTHADRMIITINQK